jgi:acetyl-CoA acetyltransferase
MVVAGTRPSPERRAVIVGIGATEFSKASGRSELRLATEATLAALADAGLERGAVDGAVTFTMDSTPETELARSAGFGDLRFFARAPHGGHGGCATLLFAALAVESGSAHTVVCYRALNERSGVRFGQAGGYDPGEGAEGVRLSWLTTFGATVPATFAAILARRYMHETGATSEDFGRLSVLSRRNAATNPNAWFYEKPITLEDHQNSRLISDPLRLLDCCQETDGAVALIITTAERGRHLRQRPVEIVAAAQGAGPEQEGLSIYHRADMTDPAESRIVARQLWERSGLGPADLDVAIAYDHFTPLVLMQLEAFGLCGRGEAGPALRDGFFNLDGKLPLNTHGGHLGEGYIHGMNGIAEAVRQLRGTAVNQVAGAHAALVTSGGAGPTSGALLAA